MKPYHGKFRLRETSKNPYFAGSSEKSVQNTIPLKYIYTEHTNFIYLFNLKKDKNTGIECLSQTQIF